MSVATTFIEHRVRALAAVFLTRRPDLEMIDFEAGELDLLIRIRPEEHGEEVLQGYFLHFGVILQGTGNEVPNEQAASRHLQSWKRQKSHATRFCFPVVTLLYSTAGDKGYYAWNTAPILSRNGKPMLSHGKHYECHPIGSVTLDEMVKLVLEWYKSLIPAVVRD